MKMSAEKNHLIKLTCFCCFSGFFFLLFFFFLLSSVDLSYVTSVIIITTSMRKETKVINFAKLNLISHKE